MEGLVRKGLHLPSVEWLMEHHKPFPRERMRLPPALRKDCEHLTPEEKQALWVIERRKRLGASDKPIIMGTSKFKSSYALACDKLGLIEPDFEETEYQEFGREMENVAANRLRRVMGSDVQATIWDPRSIGFLHPTLDFSIVTPDRFLMLGDGTKAAPHTSPLWVPVEIKNVSEFAKDDWGTATIPDMYYDQVQDQMAALEADMLIVAAVLGGNRMVPYTIYRDVKRIGLIEAESMRWWQQVMIDGILPEVDGSDSTTEALKKRFLRGKDEKKPLTDEARALIDEYLLQHRRADAFKKGQKAAEELKDKAGNALREWLGDTWVAEDEGGRKVTWKASEKKVRDAEAEANDAELQEAARIAKTRQEALKKEIVVRSLLVSDKSAPK